MLIVSFLLAVAVPSPSTHLTTPIDRKALVTRHNVTVHEFNETHPIQVGNGEIAFGLDLTGLQTFIPFNTMSHWGWSSSPLPAGTHLEDYHRQVWETHGRPVKYPLPDPEHPAISTWLAGNPHRINLGRIGLTLMKRDGTPALRSDLQNPSQTLDLWSGVVTSQFTLEGNPVTVKTACHPGTDTLAVQIDSPLVKLGRVGAFFGCPGDDSRQFADYVGDWNHPVKFNQPNVEGQNSAVLSRDLEGGGYKIGLRWDGSAKLSEPDMANAKLTILHAEYGSGDQWADVTDRLTDAIINNRLAIQAGPGFPDPIVGVEKVLRVDYALGGFAHSTETHENNELVLDGAEDRSRLVLTPDPTAKTLAFTCTFSQRPLPAPLPRAHDVLDASKHHWAKFWSTGGAIDLSGSTDPRWKELERRIVLSQYLMAVNEAGSLPPQESGLVNNGWFGRFHMEMVWWHGAHWALWNRWTEFDRYLGIYQKLLPSAKSLAASEGYEGARWPKCIGPDGREWPFYIHSFLIWQQPHPIFFAELAYRANPSRATLEKWLPVVEASADFMATYAFLDPVKKEYVLGPPLIPVSENLDPGTAYNPAFELGYWRFGLRVANEWRQRLGLKPKAKWAMVLAGLSPIPQQDGVYVLNEGVKDMWTKFNFEHPALIGTYGMLPGDGVDLATMHRTLHKVESLWNFDRTWGWDFPMLAMAAARLGEPTKAVDFLLSPSGGFQFDPAGYATGGPFPYMPSNGGLLYAVALMAAGWDGGPKAHAPGFPTDGTWNVRWEGLKQAP